MEESVKLKLENCFHRSLSEEERSIGCCGGRRRSITGFYCDFHKIFPLDIEAHCNHCDKFISREDYGKESDEPTS